MNNVNLKANSERNGAFSGDSSTNSKSFEGKVHLHRSSLSDSKDVAKLQKNTETAKDKNKNNKAHSYEVTKIELLDGLSNSPRLEMVDSNPSISAAKVQQNSEITKLSSKKELPPAFRLQLPGHGSSSGGEPFFKSLSEFSSDPRRRADAPVVTYSALSSSNRLHWS